MSNQFRTRRAAYGYIPPHIIQSIARQGKAGQREWAIRALSQDATFRGLRTSRRPGTGGTRAPGGVKDRTIFDAQNGFELPGIAVRREGEAPVVDVAVNEAYDGIGATYDLLWDIYDRNSIDGDGMALQGVVHFLDSYPNAFWDGQYMVFGDGDGELFNRFTIAVDIMGHEMMHGVTADETPLEYYAQSGALHESLSDVFGTLVKQRVLGQTVDQADWICGAGIFKPGINGVGIRSMKAPGTAYDDPILGKDPQPDHMKNYVRTMEDSGGVHINSGIPNHAFYMMAMEVGGYAWEKCGHIWYETLLDPQIREQTSFATFARRTLAAAARLYGATSAEYKAVKKGWVHVGILVL